VKERDRVLVVGGGISGLAAAWALTHPTACVDVTVLEADQRLGGRIATEPFAGIDLDTGPDAFLTRTSSVIDLCRAVGLGDELVAPATGAAFVWSRGRLRRLPPGLVLGVPTSVLALARAGVLTPKGTLRAALDLALPARSAPGQDGDVDAGRLVRARLGPEAHERLVDPLLGGINAGRTLGMSATVAAPPLIAASKHRSLMRGARSAAPASSGGPVFLTVHGGMTRLSQALGRGLRDAGVTIDMGEAVTGLTRADRGQWRVSTSAGRTITADAVIITLPPPAAADLLRPVSAPAAGELSSIDSSSVALVALAYRLADVAAPPHGSGFLVPRVEGRLMTACSWVTAKWPHLARPGLALLRVSAGRDGDDRAMLLDDDELIRRLHEELREAIGARRAPVEGRVTRWPNAFPQFHVGHPARVLRLESSLAVDAPGVVVAGAAYRGVGLPTCVAGAQTAVEAVRTHLTRGR